MPLPELSLATSVSGSSEGSTHHSHRITDVKEICEYLKKHTNELVDLIEDLTERCKVKEVKEVREVKKVREVRK